jgi:phage head maturation protease
MTTTNGIEYHPTEMTLECRSGAMTIGGLGIPFGTRSRPIGGRFVEVVDPGFISGARDRQYQGIVSKYAHMDEYLLGSTGSGTLRMSDDKRGVDYTVSIPPWLAWVYESTKRGDLTDSSFAFAHGAQDRWDFGEDMPVRTLLSGEVIELGPCPTGQYPDATAGLRSLAAAVDAPFEDVLARADNLRSFFRRSDQPAKPVSGRDALVATLAQEYPEVGLVDAERRNRSGKLGADALKETLAKAPIEAKARLLETMAKRWPETLTTVWDAMPTVTSPLDAAKRELAEARAEVARLSDPVLIEREAVRVEMERAEARARDTLDMVSGSLSGAAALRLTMEARPDGASDYVPRTEAPTEETETPEPEVSAEADPPRRWVPPQRRTMDGREALRILDQMRTPEPPINQGRASDCYLAELGNRF